MSSPYSPYNPSTGPAYNTSTLPFSPAIPQGPGIAYTAGLSNNTTPNPGPPAANSNGILLEDSWNSFIELENLSGWLVLE